MSPPPPVAQISPGRVWTAWSPQLLVLAGLTAAGWLYARGVRALWRAGRPGRGISPARAWAFGGGLAAILVALVSPLDALSEVLLSAHMGQHLLLLLVAPILLVVGHPAVSFVAAAPASWRRRLHRARQSPAAATAGLLARPACVWPLAASVLLVWHVPALYQGALREQTLHSLEHGTFLATGLLFWWTALSPSGRRRLPAGVDVLFVVTGGLPGAVLGALLAFAPTPLYPFYGPSAVAWRVTPLGDQQLAGAVMWIPSGVLYLCAAAWLFVRWMRTMEREQRRREASEAGAAAPHMVRPLPGTLAAELTEGTLR